MATDVIDTTTILQAGVRTSVHTVATGKRDVVTVTVTNQSGTAAVYSVYRRPSGASQLDEQAFVDNEPLSSPGSGESAPKVLGAGTTIDAISDVADVAVWVNGISQDIE